jgi:hypothetical protein
MKYVLIPYIAFGFALSLLIGIEYNCEGKEMFPDYYGSPFVFKKKSLGSSMEYFYSISGLLLNLITWTVILSLINRMITRLISRLGKQMVARIFYAIIICVLFFFTSVKITVDRVMLGRGFDPQRNYWYWNMNKEAKEWGVDCKGKVVTRW